MIEDRLKAAEDGFTLVVLALLIVVALVFIAIVLNTGYSNVIRSELQAAADAAALSAAGTLCSNKRCWNDSKIAALETIERHVMHGGLGIRAGVEFTAAQTAGGPLWDLGNLRIIVERGRWWQRERRFESFDEPDWQANHPGMPNIVGANAVRVRIERPQVEIFLSPLAAVRPMRYALAGEAIAAAGRQGEVCVAPLAIPACAVLDEHGDFDRQAACRFDRLFTESKRYCPPGVDCNILPGAFWNPTQVEPEAFTEINMEASGAQKINCPPFFWSSDLAQDWYCPHQETGGQWQPNAIQYQMQSIMTGKAWFDISEVQYEYTSIRPYWTQMPKMFTRGSKFNMPRLPTTGDHFGVVGLPVGTGAGEIDGINDEEEIRALLAGDMPCINAEIGQRFRILEPGLVEPLTDQVVWQQINNRAGGADAMHPRFGESDLGRPMVTFKHRWNNGAWGNYPIWAAAIEESREHLYDRDNAYGACNSHRWGYRAMRGEAAPRAWLDIPADPGDYEFPYFQSLAGDDAAYAGICADPNDHHFGYYEDIFVTDAVDDAGMPLEEQAPVLEISVPIISESCRGLMVPSCEGVNGSTQDPLIDPSREYEICAFMKFTIFDVDIGYPPPVYPRSECPAGINHSEHYPWGFDINAQSGGPAAAAPTNCNAIRSRPVCDTRLMATTEHQGRPTPNLVR